MAASLPATKRSARCASCRKGFVSVIVSIGWPLCVESTATKRGWSSAALLWHWRSSSITLEGKVRKSTRIFCSVLSEWKSSSEISSVYSRKASLSSVSCTRSTLWLRGCPVLCVIATVSELERSSRSALFRMTGTAPWKMSSCSCHSQVAGIVAASARRFRAPFPSASQVKSVKTIPHTHSRGRCELFLFFSK